MPQTTSSRIVCPVPGPGVEPHPQQPTAGSAAATMARAALALHVDQTGRPADSAAVLGQLAHASTGVFPAAGHVALLTCTGTKISSCAGQIISHAVQQLLQTENESGQGPCLQAAATGQQVSAGDMRQERRWPQVSMVASRWGLIGVCATPIPTPGSHRTVLLLASDHLIGDDVAALAQAWSVHVGIALTAAHRHENFGAALTSRDIIGQAKGILMERYKLTSAQAFDLLVKASTDSNTKLRVICDQLCLTGELPPRKRK